MPMSPSSFVPSEHLQPGDGAYSQAPQVRPETNYAPQQIENMGQAVSQAGGLALRTGQSMAMRIGETIDDANVKSAETQLLVQSTGITRGYMQKVGKDAIDGYDAATQALAKAKQDAAGTLTNSIQQRMYNQVATQHLTSLGGQMYDHNHQQTVSYGITSDKARAQTYALQALQASDHRYQTDFDQEGKLTGDFHAATGVMEDETRKAARLSGFADDSEQSKAMVREAWTGLNHAIIAKLLDNHDAAGADRWFQEQQAADHFEATDVERLGSAIKQEKDRQFYEDESDDNIIPRALTGAANAPVTFAPISASAPIDPTDPHITDRPGSARPDGRIHNGYDIAMPLKTDLLAPAAGTVTRVWNDPKVGGQQIEITLDDGRTVGMAHLSSISAKEGARIRQSDVIGQSGQSGNATGPSVHYMLRNADGSVGDPFTASQPQPNPAGIADPAVAQKALDLIDQGDYDSHTKKMMRQYTWRRHSEERQVQDQTYEEDVKQPAVQALYASGGNYNAIPAAIRMKLKPQDAVTMQNFEIPVKDDMPTVAGFITNPDTVKVQSVNDAFASGKLSRGSYTEFLQRAVNYAKAPNELLDASVDANNIKVLAANNGYTKALLGEDYEPKLAYLTFQVQHAVLAAEQSTGKKLDTFAKDKITKDMLVKIKTTDVSVRSWMNPASWGGNKFAVSPGEDKSRFETLGLEGGELIPDDVRAQIVTEAQQHGVANPTEDFIQKRYAQLQGGK